MHTVIAKHNNNDHRVYYYAIWMMKAGRFAMQNSKHIQSTTITSEEYL